MSSFDWIDWGTAIFTTLAIVFMAASFLAQSPRQARRTAWIGRRVSPRQMTAYALASLLVALGFFLIRVPDEPEPVAVVAGDLPTAVVQDGSESGMVALSPTEPVLLDEDGEAVTAQLVEEGGDVADSGEPESGAFTLPEEEAAEEEVVPASDGTPTVPADLNTPTSAEVETPSLEPEPTVAEDATSTPFPTITPTASSTPTSTPLPTSTPTITPSPTLTPTPFADDSATVAVVESNSSTVWVRQTPNGVRLELLTRGDLVILESGIAAQAGEVWQEVRTLSGTVGWIPERLLNGQEPEG